MKIIMPALSMKADAYVIKNPRETVNGFTKADKSAAAETLSLTGDSSIAALKELLRGYDFTSISTNELAEVGSILKGRGLVDVHVVSYLISGSQAFDERGHQAGKDIKFNAVAMFNQMLGERLGYSLEGFGKSTRDSFNEITKGLVRVNHLIAALSYFVSSDQDELSVDVEA